MSIRPEAINPRCNEQWLWCRRDLTTDSVRSWIARRETWSPAGPEPVIRSSCPESAARKTENIALRAVQHELGVGQVGKVRTMRAFEVFAAARIGIETDQARYGSIGIEHYRNLAVAD
jgi:hypothetical protein